MDPSEIADRMRSIQETVAAATVEVTSDDNAVTVVVGPAGAIRGLRLGPRAFRYSGAELGEVVVRTIREAHTLVGRELTAGLAGLAGQPSGPAPFGRPQSPDRLRAGLDGEPDDRREASGGHD